MMSTKLLYKNNLKNIINSTMIFTHSVKCDNSHSENSSKVYPKICGLEVNHNTKQSPI